MADDTKGKGKGAEPGSMAPPRQLHKLRIISAEGTVRIEGDMMAVKALQTACETTIKRWGEDASSTIVTRPDGKSTVLVFVVGIA